MTEPTFDDLCGNLPSHQDALETAYEGAPSVAVQNVTHGAPAPAEDRGYDDQAKYGHGGI